MKWHELSGNAFTDAVFLANAVASVLEGGSLSFNERVGDKAARRQKQFVECTFDTLLAVDAEAPAADGEDDGLWAFLEQIVDPCLEFLSIE